MYLKTNMVYDGYEILRKRTSIHKNLALILQVIPIIGLCDITNIYFYFQIEIKVFLFVNNLSNSFY